LHHLEIEACGENLFTAGEDYDRAIRLCPIERLVDLIENLRRKRITFAVVDADRCNPILQTVLNVVDGCGLRQ